MVSPNARSRDSDVRATRAMEKSTTEEIAASIRQELRAIVRLVWDLRRPMTVSDSIECVDGPCWVVLLEPDAHWSGSGLRLGGLANLSVPDERIIDQGYELAGHIYHLKDRLHQFVRSTERPSRRKDHTLNVSRIVDRSLDLLVCGDLVNFKKHGRNENRSKMTPSLGNAIYDTSVCGPVEVQYDGSNKATALLASTTAPVSRRIELMSKDELWRPNALDTFVAAIETWRPLIEDTGLLSGSDSESEFLRMVYSYSNEP